jgi:hypothetical protein
MVNENLSWDRNSGPRCAIFSVGSLDRRGHCGWDRVPRAHGHTVISLGHNELKKLLKGHLSPKCRPARPLDIQGGGPHACFDG